MNYPDMRNPRHVRTRIYDAYVGYMHGADMHPRIRVQREVEELPRKTQPYAAALALEWAQIDHDRDYFDQAVLKVHDILTARGDDEQKQGLVITRVGRNAVYLADVNAAENSVGINRLTLSEFSQVMPENGLANGAVTRQGDYMQGPFKGLVERDGNVSGVVGVSNMEAIRLISGITRQPVTAVTSDERL